MTAQEVRLTPLWSILLSTVSKSSRTITIDLYVIQHEDLLHLLLGLRGITILGGIDAFGRHRRFTW